MKTKSLSTTLFLIAIIFILSGCETDPKAGEENQNSDFPTTFSIEIPSSISKPSSLKSTNISEYSGNDIYSHMGNFINVGELAAQFIEDIMVNISRYNLNQPMQLTFTSEDDGKKKELKVTNQVSYDGEVWQNLVTITDQQSSKTALKVYWNTDPVKGIAVLQPRYWDTETLSIYGNTSYKVEYTEMGMHGYDKEMIVSIANWEEMKNQRFHMDNMKMFVGKKDNIIDVYGNSNHPKAYLLLDETKGYNWAFVASANISINMGVAQVGLPQSTIDNDNREVLLIENSIENVLKNQISTYVFNQYGFYPDEQMIKEYLINTEAPGYFDANGFIQAGNSPTDDYAIMESNIMSLTPYNPKTISKLSINMD